METWTEVYAEANKSADFAHLKLNDAILSMGERGGIKGGETSGGFDDEVLDMHEMMDGNYTPAQARKGRLDGGLSPDDKVRTCALGACARRALQCAPRSEPRVADNARCPTAAFRPRPPSAAHSPAEHTRRSHAVRTDAPPAASAGARSRAPRAPWPSC